LKVCGNDACKAMFGDDFAGQCHHCGRPMGDGAGGQSLAWNPLTQIAQAQAEERMVKGHDHNNLRVNPAVLDVARGFVTGGPVEIPKPNAQ
jgi:hypothetical protein